MNFLHFSARDLAEGTVLEPRGRFFAHPDVEAILEAARPPHLPPRARRVYLMALDDIDRVHRFGLAPTGTLYAADPMEPPTRHDVGFVGLLQKAHASRAYFVRPQLPVQWGDAHGLAALARLYWEGEANPYREPLWEHVTTGAVIGAPVARLSNGRLIMIDSAAAPGLR